MNTTKRLCHAVGNVLDAVRLKDSSVLDPRWAATYNKDAHIEITLTAGEIQELEAARNAVSAIAAEAAAGGEAMKKDPVLWVVVDKDGQWDSINSSRKNALRHLAWRRQEPSILAPFRVVKYVPAPKPKRKRKA